MIGRIVSTRSALTRANRVRVAISANARPSVVQPAAQSSARSTVFHTSPQRPRPAMQPIPQSFSANRRVGSARSANAPSRSCAAESEDARDRIEREEGDEQRDPDHARRDEAVAPEAAAAGEPEREEHRERCDRERGTEPESLLTRAQRRQHGRDPLERPTRRTDRESLRERIGEAACPDDGKAKRRGVATLAVRRTAWRSRAAPRWATTSRGHTTMRAATPARFPR